MVRGAVAPYFSVDGDQDRAARLARLFHAYDAMCAAVRVLWPEEEAPRSDPNAVRWAGAVVRVAERDDDLWVSWKDEDHWAKYAAVVEIAWRAAGHESGRVLHENGDPEGIALLQDELMY
jgi:hypothetical protein